MLPTRKLRDLTLEPAAGLPFLSAASGLVRIGDLLYVVADDEHHLGVFPIDAARPGRLITLFPGELPDDPDARKAAKPDLEALTVLDGAILAVPSGSTLARGRGVLWDPAAPGAPRAIDWSPLYSRCRERLPELNVEGAVVHGDALVLLQRGNGALGVNALIELDLDGVRRDIAGGVMRPDCLRAIREVKLGALEGVPLSFTDGASLGDEGILFSAAAEASPDTYRDGPCVGSALGRLSADGVLTWLEPLAGSAKVEGVAAWRDGDRIEAWLVTDADRRDRPAELLACAIASRDH